MQAARDLETDDDPERFRERVGKLVKQRPVLGVFGKEKKSVEKPGS